MYGEVCARERNVVYRNHENCSPFFYTWKESKDYPWDYSETSWNNVVVMEGEKGDHTNIISQDQQGVDYNGDKSLPNSKNAFLNGNAYHTPNHSQYSGFSVIDFPMHWNFRTAAEAFGVKYGDKYYNDATYNVMYVDSHDYAPDGAPESERFNQPQNVWAENLSLMFTFRGIPCIYYGSEIEFRKGSVIDKGPNIALSETGRAYFGGYIKGDVKVKDFADYSDATGNIAATLSHPLALHIQRLNKIRAAVPALRKGQYSCEGCTGNFAFKRRYTDDNTDSYALITISGNGTFTDIENGIYVDAVTGDAKTVTDGKLTATCSGKGNMRIYVLNTEKTPAPGKVGEDGKYLYATTPVTVEQAGYDGTEEEKSTNNGDPTVVTPPVVEPEDPIEPSMGEGEQGVFFDSTWSGSISAYIWFSNGTKITGAWPGENCTPLGNGIWKWHYSGTKKLEGKAKLIFNSTNGNQTKDLEYVNGGMYNVAGELVKVIEGAGEIPDEPDTPAITTNWTFYFDNTSTLWNKINAYFWDKNSGETYLGSWPGTAMTEGNENIWSISFTTTDAIGEPMIIFNNGSQQTKDFKSINYGVYTFNGFDHDGVESANIDNMEITSSDGVLYIKSQAERNINIVFPNGITVSQHINAGNNIISNLATGVYIIEGKKIVL